MFTPGQCRSCGGAKLPLIDMQYLEEYHGAVYYCVECITEIATLFGFADSSTMEKKNEEIARLVNKVDALLVTNSELEYINDAINRAGYTKLPTSFNTGTPDMFDSVSVDSDNIETVVETDAAIPVFNSTVDSATGSTDEQADGENLAGFRTSRSSAKPNKSGLSI